MGYRRLVVTDNVYTFTEVVGTSAESWEKAAATAVERAAKTLRDLRVAEVVKLDMELEGGQVRACTGPGYRSPSSSRIPADVGTPTEFQRGRHVALLPATSSRALTARSSRRSATNAQPADVRDSEPPGGWSG
jgi:hypothetical protein